MNFERLAMFVRIVEAGSLSAAAPKVHLTQPALSRNLKLFEEELGVALFHRRGRGLQLTAAGRALSERAPALLASVDSVALVVGRSAERGYFDVRIGAVDSVTTYLLPDVLAQLTLRHPALVLRLWVARSATLLERLHAGTLDLAIVASSGPPPLPGARSIGRYGLRYFGRADLFPELSRARTPAALAAFPVVQIEGPAGQPGVTPAPSQTFGVAQNVSSVKALVLAGFGVGDLPDYVFSAQERARLVAAPIHLDPHCGLYVVPASGWTGAREDELFAQLRSALAAALSAGLSGAGKKRRRR